MRTQDEFKLASASNRFFAAIVRFFRGSGVELTREQKMRIEIMEREYDDLVARRLTEASRATGARS